MLGYYVHDLNPYIFRFPALPWPLEFLSGFGPRWYGFAYLLGFVIAYSLLVRLQRRGFLQMPRLKVADLVLNCCIFGVLVGGRLGHVFFYDLPEALTHGQTPALWDFHAGFPFWGVLEVWRGGMSAHGGVIGVVLTLIVFARRNRLAVVNIGDAACMVVAMGLLCGRVANFINGELYGRPTQVAWAVKFPTEISAPTNGVPVVPRAAIQDLKRGVAEYLAGHPQELTDAEAQAFVRVRLEEEEARQRVGGGVGGAILRIPADPLIQELKEKIGPPNWADPKQVGMIKEMIGRYVERDPGVLGGGELVTWLQTGRAGLRAEVRREFDKILSPRHPSQLYEALLEGALLFAICWLVGTYWRRPGMAGGAFLTLYPVMRIIGEQFRVGDAPPAGLAWTHVSAGVLYSLPMLVIGVGWWVYWVRKPVAAAEASKPAS